MGCGVYWQQVHETERALGVMERAGIAETEPSWQSIWENLLQLMGQVGRKLPRTLTRIAKLVGLSPGVISLWHDSEQGWMSEARVEPGAPPVYKAASDEVAMAILKEEITPELEQQLLTPDVGVDN